MLSKRLKSIANFIEKKDNLVDIGTDHALLPIYLINNKLVRTVIATDISPNALNQAKKNISEKKYENIIKLIQTDGLKNIDLTNINAITLSGVGTSTVIKIFKDLKKLPIEKIVIQSNNDYFELRKYFTKNNYYIFAEDTFKDKGKYYTTICFKKGYQKYTNIQMYYGIAPYNKEYLNELKNKFLTIKGKIPRSKIYLGLRLKMHLKYIDKLINN